MAATKFSSTSYRPDIDGLRAVAVLSVVLNHAGFALFSGGFVGVDVFFVISGYLITKIIFDEIREDNFLFSRFYMRRASRILPPLLAVGVVTFILGYFTLLPEDLRSLGKQFTYSAVFLVNILFKNDAVDYFHSASELKPLLHLWSLSVEEQFYLFWPPLLLLVARSHWKTRIFVGTILMASFLAACWMLFNAQSKNVFFLLPYRAWELAIGALLAVWPVTWPSDSAQAQRIQNWVSIIGLVLIIGADLFLSSADAFPAWNALWPTLGATAIVAAGPTAWGNRYILSCRPVVFIGLISYALYLWHWPLLALSRVMHMGDLPASWAAVTIIVSMILATGSWMLIENPVRRWAAAPSTAFLQISIGARLLLLSSPIAIFLSLGAICMLTDGMLGRFSPAQQTSLNDHLTVRTEGACNLVLENERIVAKSGCEKLGQVPAVVSWGDSHAFHYIHGLVEYLKGQTLLPVLISEPGCPPLIGVERIDDDRRCEKKTKIALKYFIESAHIETIVISARFVSYALSKPFGTEKSAPIKLISMDGKNSDQKDLVIDQLESTINILRMAGKKVVIINELPTQKFDVRRCYLRKDLFPDQAAVFHCDISSNEHFSRTEVVAERIRKMGEKYTDVCIFDPGQILCSGKTCQTEIDGRPIYHDNNHLNDYGSKKIGKFFDFSRCIPGYQRN